MFYIRELERLGKMLLRSLKKNLILILLVKQNLKIYQNCIFLDITLNLSVEKYWPYSKPDNHQPPIKHHIVCQRD